MKYLSTIPLAFQSFFSINSTQSITTLDIDNMPKFPSNPEWKPILQEALKSQPVTFFQLATVSEPLVPKCRTLTLTGFVGEAPYAKDSAVAEDSRNSAEVTSDVIVVASDVRSNKYKDLEVSQKVEAAFFVAALWTQFRIRGTAYPISPGVQHGELEVLGRKHVEAHLNTPSGAKWDWDSEILKIWEKQDPKKIKAKFPEPTPEEPVPKDFRLLVIVPEEVEELAPGDGKLITWTSKIDGEAAKWELSSEAH